MLYSDIETREARYIEIKSWLDDKINIIDDIPNNAIKGIAYFALIECFAQEYFHYPIRCSNDIFCKFIERFHSNYSILFEYDPVTMYYRFKKLLSKQFSLNFLEEACIYTISDIAQNGIAQNMIEVLQANNVDKRKIKSHKYIKLLYCLRSKLSHEFNASNIGLNYHPCEYPYYLSLSRSYEINAEKIRDDVWELIIPVKFIKKLGMECIYNYLDYVKTEKKDPFQNNSFLRPSNLCWYDN